MRLSQTNIGVLVWLASAACLVFGFFGFAVVAPWTFDVMSAADAARRCPGVIDPTWPAVVCSHGRPYEWELGLISDNPVRYFTALLQMIVGLSLFFVGAVLLKRFRT
jgi:hypothetical protein